MNKQDEKLYTEIEVQSLIFASNIKHYNETEKQTEIDHDELLAKLIQEEKKATRYKNKYNELKGSMGDDRNYRQMCQKLIKERDMYKKMYLEEKNRK